MSSSLGKIVEGENLEVLRSLSPNSVRLVYIDPPFNTGKKQRRNRIRVKRDTEGTRKGFQGKTYQVERVSSPMYVDRFDDYVLFLMERVEACLPALTADASLFVHVDYREAHYVKVALDELLGRDSFMNEIIWSYDYGGRSKKKWPAKHDNIFWYARDPSNYVFNYDDIDRIPYLAPNLVSKEKAERGKVPTDVWWHTIVPTGGKEKTGYPTQKPLGILERIIKVHSNPGDTVLDFFGGSGTTGDAAAKHGRDFILIDSHPEAIDVMQKRLQAWSPKVVRSSDLISSKK